MLQSLTGVGVKSNAHLSGINIYVRSKLSKPVGYVIMQKNRKRGGISEPDGV